ncbi:MULTISPECIES: ABC transporter ATP-binding protein [unclassified Rhizobium]|uniref:ABC transporter ATP-binding protein n=1 Tax=unclassified Rhizobium TaxID=2613769 RepID=UPI000715B150|nr:MULTISPECIES: ABC transporter ATP-binding protein [unclassified Rhizobium]KQS97974.1 ABC transporter ATP-binding protein [Rhizobium sp. Leaf386]KQT00232.1 ABC transporter ATP-binding protein [Rhizobium sp. Leaf391]KQT97236.1 ABC transporter ATP-binding protein [Rhizobium sp. Leaf453]
MAQLILNHVSKDFGTGQAAVRDVSLKVREGGFLALLGASGCGKTTLLRMIAGFEEPTEGSIILGERTLADGSGSLPPEKRNMAMVFQSYALWPHMTVAQNVGYPLKVRGVTGAAFDVRVREALSVVRLEDFASRRPAELSGGQRQRVALARCLVSSPDVVLLDEPLANLDRHLKAAMLETFREFHARSGATMIYVTHDQSEAMALATDVAVMSEGRLLQVAAPEEIYARPEGHVVGGLIGQGAVLELVLPDHDSRLMGWPMIEKAFRQMGGPRRAILVRPEHVVADPDGVMLQVRSCVYEGERFVLSLLTSGGQALQAYSPFAVVPGSLQPFVIRQGWLV